MRISQQLTGPLAVVHEEAIADNARYFSSVAPLIAVVKADGFGHGMIPAARAALHGGAFALGVTSLEEAYTLRRGGISAPVLSWLNSPRAEFAWAIRAGVSVAIPSGAHLAEVVHAALSTKMRASVHLFADVGMCRDGAAPAEFASLVGLAARAERAGLIKVEGLMGHLPCADLIDNHDGVAHFRDSLRLAELAGLRPRYRHLAATSGARTDPDTHFDAVRVGAGLYGIDPTANRVSALPPLRPAMSLIAPVVALRDVQAGESVGYGHTWTAPVHTRLATIPLGYADGIPLKSPGAEVWLAGGRRPIVGRISMDQIVVDLGDGTAEIGETATVFGPGDQGEPTAAEWARWADTLEHDIVTGIGSRVERVYGADRWLIAA